MSGVVNHLHVGAKLPATSVLNGEAVLGLQPDDKYPHWCIGLDACKCRLT